MKRSVMYIAMLLVIAGASVCGAETLQNYGTCNDQELGCTNGSGTEGNPNDMIECFNSATLAPPFGLTEATYIIGVSTPPPDDLSLRVYEWSGAGPPGALITDIPLGPGDRTAGPHAIALNPPVVIPTADFCVGVHGDPANDGFSLATSTQNVAGASWLKAPFCAAPSFTLLSDFGFPNHWCMTATIQTPGPNCNGVPATIVGTANNDVLIGTPNDDVIVGRGGNDEIQGRGGNDLICGGPGADELFGGGGNDTIFGGGDKDDLFGGGGNDELHGEGGNDEIEGGPGNDTLRGGGGRDFLDGQGGTDDCAGGPGRDRIRRCEN